MLYSKMKISQSFRSGNSKQLFLHPDTQRNEYFSLKSHIAGKGEAQPNILFSANQTDERFFFKCQRWKSTGM